MKVSFLESGYCVHPESLLFHSLNSWNRITRFPNTVVLIEHPTKGKILFDTGYSPHFFEATRRFPEKPYRMLAPVTLKNNDNTLAKLGEIGIRADEIDYIILSHFHADHVAGIHDFPKAKFIFIDEAYKHVASLSRLQGLKSGFLKALIPENFASRGTSIPLSQMVSPVLPLAPFDQTFDVFGDGSIIGVSLPGHVLGHWGIYVESEQGKYFFIADTCWDEEEYLEGKSLGRVANLVIHDRSSYDSTLDRMNKFHQNHPDVQIIPCHCMKSHRKAGNILPR